MLTLFEIPEIKKEKPKKGIAVDCSVINGNPGNGEFRGVDLQTNKILFSHKIPGITTNNCVEFFAIVVGVDYLIRFKLNGKVYSDSLTALAWYRKKKHKCKLKLNNETAESHRQLSICMSKIPKLNHMDYVQFWNNKSMWGEIPADYNRK